VRAVTLLCCSELLLHASLAFVAVSAHDAWSGHMTRGACSSKLDSTC